jgi:hypothetical protein
MSTFLERIIWPFSKPERKVLTIYGCPKPRSEREKKAVIIVTSGIVPPLYRKLCDWATSHIKGVIKDALNAKTVGDMYAGAVEHRGANYYFDKAFKLGMKLV